MLKKISYLCYNLKNSVNFHSSLKLKVFLSSGRTHISWIQPPFWLPEAATKRHFHQECRATQPLNMAAQFVKFGVPMIVSGSRSAYEQGLHKDMS